MKIRSNPKQKEQSNKNKNKINEVESGQSVSRLHKKKAKYTNIKNERYIIIDSKH